MIVQMYSVFDLAARVYAVPFFVRNSSEAASVFQQEVRNEQSVIHHSPSDFELHCVGTFDTLTAQVVPVEKVAVVLRAVEVINAS